MPTIRFLAGHDAHLARIAILWRRCYRRSGQPSDLDNADRVMALAFGGAR